MINFTDEQQIIIDEILRWYKEAKEQVMVISGFAGTGKTTIMSHLPKVLPDTTRITFNTFTGKASSVLFNKLKDSDVWGVNTTTLHKLMYKPKIKRERDGTEYVDGWEKNESIPYDLIIVDEASMISEELFSDIIGYDKPVIFIGDSFQLPPIFGDFNVMNAPDFSLTSIHRQAEGSPIIQLSKYIRENWMLPRDLNSNAIKEIVWWKKEDRVFFDKIPFLNPNIITLSGLNKTRKFFNYHIRNLCGYNQAGIINPGERIVCLKNNDVIMKTSVQYVMNGITGTVKNVSGTKHDRIKNISIDFDMYEDDVHCLSDTRCFGEIDKRRLAKISGDPRNKAYAKLRKQKAINMIDYGYNITVHKSQGSEWAGVILINERSSYMKDEDYARWLYTAITRASTKLFIVNDFI